MGSPYYHTEKDTPDKVDTAFLAQAVDRYDVAVSRLLASGPTCCEGPDEDLYEAVASLSRTPSGELSVDLAVTDANGVKAVGAAVEATLLTDDFFLVGEGTTTTDGDGRARIVFSREQAGSLREKSFVHVTAGRDYPLVERVLSVP